jgi:transposase-like protein
MEDRMMVDEFRVALEELLRKAQFEGQVDVLRESVQTMAQALMELEVVQHVDAGRYERTASRTGQRNGTREQQRDTRVGTIELQVPRVQDGSYFPSLLDPRKRAERARAALVRQCWANKTRIER